MQIEIEDRNSKIVLVHVDYDAALDLFVAELGAIPDALFFDDKRLHARLKGELNAAVARALKAAARGVLERCGGVSV